MSQSTTRRLIGGGDAQLQSFLNSALDEMDGQIHTPTAKLPRGGGGREHIFIEQEAGRASEPIRTLLKERKICCLSRDLHPVSSDTYKYTFN